MRHCGFKRVFKQHCYRHRSYAAWHRAYETCLFADTLKIHIAHELAICEPVYTYIDNDNAVFYHISP